MTKETSTKQRSYFVGYNKGYKEATKDLQKENEDLRKRNSELAGQKASLERWFGEAKGIIKEILDTPQGWQSGGEWYENEDYNKVISKAEAFLKEQAG